MNYTHVVSAAVGAFLLFCFAGMCVSGMNDSLATNCDSLGKFRASGHVYECNRIGDEVKP